MQGQPIVYARGLATQGFSATRRERLRLLLSKRGFSLGLIINPSSPWDKALPCISPVSFTDLLHSIEPMDAETESNQGTSAEEKSKSLISPASKKR
ncbi:MAG: hypothetical protein AB8A46_07905 [Prochlorococcus sp.]